MRLASDDERLDDVDTCDEFEIEVLELLLLKPHKVDLSFLWSNDNQTEAVDDRHSDWLIVLFKFVWSEQSTELIRPDQ